MRIKEYLLISTIISLLLIMYNIVVLNNYTPVGYSIDIYSQLPSIFWYNLIVVYFIGCGLVLQKNTRFKKVGVISLLINYSLIYLVPYALGYYIYGTSDELSHMGEFKNIMLTGHVDQYNVYPLIHILYSITSLASNVSPNILSFILPGLFSIIFILGIFIFSRHMLCGYNKAVYLVIPISFIYYFGHFHFSNVPNYAYFTLIPIIFFMIAKNMDSKVPSRSVILTIFMISLPLAHPFIFFFIAYILFIIGFTKINKKNNLNTLFLLIMLSFTIWFINSYYIKELSKIYNTFRDNHIDSVATKSIGLMSKIDLEGMELLKFIYLFGGRYIIPSFFILLFFYTLLKSGKTYGAKSKTVYCLFVMLIVFGLYQLILLLNPFISHGPDRIINLSYLVFAIVPLFSLSLCNILKLNDQWLSILKTSFILTLIFTSSLYGAFYSPYTHQPNIGTTYDQINGMEWLFNNKGNMPIYDLLGEIGQRYSDLLNGWSETENRYGKDIFWTSAGKVQDHFGYDNNTNENFDGYGSYIIITTEQELIYQTVYDNIGRYNKSDFIRFRNDPIIDKIYDNLDIEIYLS